MVWATIHQLCRKSSGGCLPMIAHVDIVPIKFHFYFFPWRRILHYTTQNLRSRVRISSHVSQSCTAGYPGCSVLCWVTWVLQTITPNLRISDGCYLAHLHSVSLRSKDLVSWERASKLTFWSAYTDAVTVQAHRSRKVLKNLCSSRSGHAKTGQG